MPPGALFLAPRLRAADPQPLLRRLLGSGRAMPERAGQGSRPVVSTIVAGAHAAAGDGSSGGRGVRSRAAVILIGTQPERRSKESGLARDARKLPRAEIHRPVRLRRLRDIRALS